MTRSDLDVSNYSHMLDRALDLAHVNNLDLGQVYAYADLVSVHLKANRPAAALGHALTLIAELDLHLEQARGDNLIEEAVECIEDAREIARALLNSLDVVRHDHALPVAGARRLASLAVRLLPCPDRVEYQELFHSELYDLHCGWWGQVRYALRVLVRAPLLRHELREIRRQLAT
ncbi:MAG TPA: hypothetical protein VFX16_10825 [Pseudonocardiaceae bacterium]|nr:hypothetical protein [Pseudonocardiaceae bacterium]